MFGSLELEEVQTKQKKEENRKWGSRSLRFLCLVAIKQAGLDARSKYQISHLGVAGSRPGHDNQESHWVNIWPGKASFD